MKKHAKRKIKKQTLLLKTHRYIGLASFLILCWLAVSGLFLNHTEELQLSHKVSNNKLLLSLYNIPEPIFTKAVKLKKKWLVGINNDLYLGELKLSATYTPPFVSALSKDDLLLLSTKKELLIFTQEGEYIDALSTDANIQKLGVSDNENITIKTTAGCFIADQDFTQLSNCIDGIAIQWVQPKKLSSAVKASLLSKYKGNGISLERVFLDTHSGRIFGIAGVYFMDTMAILIIIIGLTGFLIWLIRKIKKKQKKKAK